MLVVAVTGGIGSGKSLVASHLGKLGAARIDMDEVVRELQMPGTATCHAIVEAFGPSVLTREGRLDRKALAQLVFRDAAARKRLEAIVHPAAFREVENRLARFRAAGVKLAVVEVPLLVESQPPIPFDRVISVAAREETRLARLSAARGWSRAETEARMAAQVGEEVRRKRADYVVDNDGALERTREQVEAIYHELLGAG